MNISVPATLVKTYLKKTLFIQIMFSVGLFCVFVVTPSIQAQQARTKIKSKKGQTVNKIQTQITPPTVAPLPYYEPHSRNRYEIILDLVGCIDDMLRVSVHPPTTLQGSTFRYILPRSVPGTYSKDDYGKFVVNAQAYNINGKELPTSRDDNDIIIKGIPERIEYWVKDTWDDAQGRDVFQPTGSNIQCDTNMLINTHCFFGYLENYKNLPYEITVIKPQGFYGATSLKRGETTTTTDIFFAETYPSLVDNPIMYCTPDTTSFYESGTNVMVAVYSHNKIVTSQRVANQLKGVAHALGKFFGVMPVDRYTFIFYFAGAQQSTITRSMAFGALEHSYSSVYFLPEGSGRDALEMISSTAAHEFLHILVPLNLHSKEIHDFDFRAPTMSKHLWLYEGCTEYFSMLSRAQDTLMSEREFVREMVGKYRSSYSPVNKPLSLVTLSTRVLEPEYQKIYPIIYEQGAVTAFFMDLKIRELSKNSMNLLSMISTLTKKYGPQRPFDDNSLFEEIYQLVGDGIKPFFADYVIGDKRLPASEYFEKIGYSFKDSAQVPMFQFGAANLFYNRDTSELTVLRVRRENDFGAKDGDVLVRVNDIIVTPGNRLELFAQFIWQPRTGDRTTLRVKRGIQEIDLQATPKPQMQTVRMVAEQSTTPTEAQLFMKKQLFKK